MDSECVCHDVWGIAYEYMMSGRAWHSYGPPTLACALHALFVSCADAQSVQWDATYWLTAGCKARPGLYTGTHPSLHSHSHTYSPSCAL